jgi:D-ribose pyranose/furanose isomerase RbsD
VHKTIRYILAIAFVMAAYIETKTYSVPILGVLTFLLSELAVSYASAANEAHELHKEQGSLTLRLAQQVKRQGEALVMHAEHIDAMKTRTERRKTARKAANAGG